VPKCFIGNANKGTIYEEVRRGNKINNTITATMESSASMQMWMVTESGFGRATFENDTPQSAYYKNPTIQPNSVMMNYNFQGMGLPYEYWLDVTTMLL